MNKNIATYDKYRITSKATTKEHKNTVKKCFHEQEIEKHI